MNVWFPSKAVTITGEPRDYLSIADSGNRIHRQFCGHCGAPLFSAAEVRPHVLLARAGTLDDPEIAKPLMTIWTKQAPSWACFNADLPQVAGQPPPAG